MTYKIHIIENIENLNDLNSLDYDIEVLIIKKMNFLNITNHLEYEYKIMNIFKKIQLPIMLKCLVIKKIKTFDLLIDDNQKLLSNMMVNLKLPFNCKAYAVYTYCNMNNTKSFNIVYYSSLVSKKNKIYKPYQLSMLKKRIMKIINFYKE